MRNPTAHGVWIAAVVLVGGCSSCFDRAGKRPQPPSQAEQVLPLDPPPDQPDPQRIRPAAKAGTWYPGTKDQLIPLLDKMLAKAPVTAVQGRVVALISPHAGYSYSGKAAAAGYRLLRGQDIRRVVILAVSHGVPFDGASVAEVDYYQTPLGLIPVDSAAVGRLRRRKVIGTQPEAHLQEHSLEMQLPLLQRVLPAFTLVPIVLSRVSAESYGALAEALMEEVIDQHTLVVASTDFTHRGPNYSYEVPPGPGSIQERLKRLDQGAVEPILRLDRKAFLAYQKKTGATICGRAPVALLLELLSRAQGVKGTVLSHYTSGDVSGSWESTVTYVGMAFTGSWPALSPQVTSRRAGETSFPLSDQDKQTLLRLARESLDAAVRRGRFDPAAARRGSSSSSLQRKAGAFVTLKCKLGPGAVCVGKGDGLRGCIGTIAPISSVHDTVARRAASAALEDPRFPKRVAPAELALISIEVSVLTPPRQVKDPAQIVVGQHGIILSKGGRSATFLPQVAPEQGWDRETTLNHLARKAGLSTDGWRQGTSFSVYEAIVFSERVERK